MPETCSPMGDERRHGRGEAPGRAQTEEAAVPPRFGELEPKVGGGSKITHSLGAKYVPVLDETHHTCYFFLQDNLMNDDN